MNDLRFALRQLTRAPSFTAVTVLTLAVGAGACIAMFSVVDSVLLRPPPLPEPERVVLLNERFQGGAQDLMVAGGKFLDWQRQARSWGSIVATTGGGRTFDGGGEPVRWKGLSISVGALDTLGVQPLLGRGFLPEDQPDGPELGKVAILSYGLWQRQFGGRPDVVGHSIQLDGRPATVVGVLPRGAEIPDGNGVQDSRDVEVFTPLGLGPRQRQDYVGHWLKVFGRLRPGVTLAEAQHEMNVIAARTAEAQPASRGWGVRLVPLRDAVVRPVRPVLLSLVGAVGFLLLIACANVANLLLARATSRSKEIAVRLALGAGRGRVVRQLLVESVLLSLIGGALGLLLARAGLNALVALAPGNLPRAGNIAIDGRAVVFTLALAVVTGVVFGLAPALHAVGARGRLQETLKQSARGASEGGRRQRLRAALVVGQVAIAVILLAGAGLLLRSFVGLLQVSPGFNPDNALTLRANLQDGIEARQRPAAFVERALEQMARLPGVRAAAVASRLPFLESDQTIPFSVVGRPPLTAADRPLANLYSVSPDYFRAMGIPLVRGRLFDGGDAAEARPVAIISDAIARRFFPGESAIGRSIDAHGVREIVGVVADVKTDRLDGAFSMQTYQPYAQAPSLRTQFVVRTAGAPEAQIPALRAAIARLDRRIPIYNVSTLATLVGDSIARQRFAMILFAVFSAVALLLAAIGIYGVMAYSVAQRRAEIGVRMALGAHAGQVLRLVFAQGGRLIAAGMLAGVIGALLLTRFLETLLHDLSAHDPLTFAAIIVLLALVAGAACLLPARSAARVSPMVALRSE
jgi:putative ABC transport system permease protein